MSGLTGRFNWHYKDDGKTNFVFYEIDNSEVAIALRENKNIKSVISWTGSRRWQGRTAWGEIKMQLATYGTDEAREMFNYYRNKNKEGGLYECKS